jgi:hypothetical protein
MCDKPMVGTSRSIKRKEPDMSNKGVARFNAETKKLMSHYKIGRNEAIKLRNEILGQGKTVDEILKPEIPASQIESGEILNGENGWRSIEEFVGNLQPVDLSKPAQMMELADQLLQIAGTKENAIAAIESFEKLNFVAE